MRGRPTRHEHVSDIVLERKTPLWWWIGFGFSLSLLLLFVVALALAVLPGRRGLGHHLAGRLGVRDRQLCLVGRHGERRDHHFRAVLFDPVRMAQRHQPHRGIHDGVLRRLRRHHADHSSWALVVFLLAVSLSRTRWGHGRSSAVRCIGTSSAILVYVIATRSVLVCRPDPGSWRRCATAPHTAGSGSSTVSWRWAGRDRRGTGGSTARPIRSWRR